MATLRRQRFVHNNVAWMLLMLVVLIVAGSLSFQLFFAISLLGFLMLVELSSPFNVAPRWRTRLSWVVRGGFVLFGYFVVMEVLRSIPPGVF
ncbi:hypothetical protein [Haladaptatus sp. DYSN1]|uniref:hypothetical protein n=1 Tax=unclassified Haladaptatus TaxID=2622732 RepID=UPI002406BBB1|nr:hypothetical protein [Haladaptatus sp. DYSN1]